MFVFRSKKCRLFLTLYTNLKTTVKRERKEEYGYIMYVPYNES